MLDSRESAEDATSEVFLKLQRTIESYDGSIPFPKWLLRVAGNQCIDVLRRRKRGRKVIVEVEDGAAVIEATSAEPSPLGAVLSKEERVQVRDTIARLPENYRVPLVLRYYSELSYDEIAQQLGLERNHVAALIFRAKQELRRKLAPQEQVIMECYSEQSLAIFVDGELAAEEARRLRDHLATCRRCRQLLDALRAENRALSESLQELPEEAASPVAFSRLRCVRGCGVTWRSWRWCWR